PETLWDALLLRGRALRDCSRHPYGSHMGSLILHNPYATHAPPPPRVSLPGLPPAADACRSPCCMCCCDTPVGRPGVSAVIPPAPSRAAGRLHIAVARV